MSKMLKVKKPKNKQRKRRQNEQVALYPGMSSWTSGFSVRNSKLQPFPPRFRTLENYSDIITYSLTAGIMQDYIFRLNSTFDPDLTGTGHQPTGRDTYATIYNRYRVLGVKWRLQLSVRDNATILLAAIPNNTATPYATTASDLMEQSRCVWVVAHTSLDQAIINAGVKLHDLTGVSVQEYLSDDRFQSLASTSPTEVLDLHLSVLSLDNAPNTRVWVSLEYEVEWFDPLPVSQS